jgi:16S rRNA (cytosine1402-N4)-methyltransferase
MDDRSHVPVLLHEVLDLLAPRPGAFVVDGTLGRGGHAAELLRRISPGGTLLGIDQDPTRITHVEQELTGVARTASLEVNVRCVHGNYADLPHLMPDGRKADAVLLDLGFASDQLASGRGFSFQQDEPLQMTYDPEAEPLSALLDELDEAEIAHILREYGGERFPGRIAKAIARNRPVMTSGKLARLVTEALPGNATYERIHPATRTFQALRIYANHELENLQQFLANIPQFLAPDGRLAIITFHSLEARLVKDTFRKLAQQKQAVLLTKRAIAPQDEEVATNPRSRSAKLRGIRYTPTT